LSTAALPNDTIPTVSCRTAMMLAIRFRMVSVFPVPGGPSMTEIVLVSAFSTAVR
jgi:hypothetical protein